MAEIVEGTHSVMWIVQSWEVAWGRQRQGLSAWVILKVPSTCLEILGISSCSASLLPSPHRMPHLGFLSENPAMIILQTGEFVPFSPQSARGRFLELGCLGVGCPLISEAARGHSWGEQQL